MRLSILFLKTFFTIFAQLTPLWGSLAIVISALGVYIGHAEGVGWFDGLYFGWITGLTIGYGDISPTRPFTKVLCVIIGLIGIVSTGLIVSMAVASGKAVSQHLGLDDDIAQKVKDKLNRD